MFSTLNPKLKGALQIDNPTPIYYDYTKQHDFGVQTISHNPVVDEKICIEMAQINAANEISFNPMKRNNPFYPQADKIIQYIPQIESSVVKLDLDEIKFDKQHLPHLPIQIPSTHFKFKNSNHLDGRILPEITNKSLDFSTRYIQHQSPMLDETNIRNVYHDNRKINSNLNTLITPSNLILKESHGLIDPQRSTNKIRGSIDLLPTMSLEMKEYQGIKNAPILNPIKTLKVKMEPIHGIEFKEPKQETVNQIIKPSFSFV